MNRLFITLLVCGLATTTTISNQASVSLLSSSLSEVSNIDVSKLSCATPQTQFIQMTDNLQQWSDIIENQNLIESDIHSLKQIGLLLAQTRSKFSAQNQILVEMGDVKTMIKYKLNLLQFPKKSNFQLGQSEINEILLQLNNLSSEDQVTQEQCTEQLLDLVNTFVSQLSNLNDQCNATPTTTSEIQGKIQSVETFNNECQTNQNTETTTQSVEVVPTISPAEAAVQALEATVTAQEAAQQAEGAAIVAQQTAIVSEEAIATATEAANNFVEELTNQNFDVPVLEVLNEDFDDLVDNLQTALENGATSEESLVAVDDVVQFLEEAVATQEETIAALAVETENGNEEAITQLQESQTVDDIITTVFEEATNVQQLISEANEAADIAEEAQQDAQEATLIAEETVVAAQTAAELAIEAASGYFNEDVENNDVDQESSDDNDNSNDDVENTDDNDDDDVQGNDVDVENNNDNDDAEGNDSNEESNNVNDNEVEGGNNTEDSNDVDDVEQDSNNDTDNGDVESDDVVQNNEVTDDVENNEVNADDNNEQNLNGEQTSSEETLTQAEEGVQVETNAAPTSETVTDSTQQAEILSALATQLDLQAQSAVETAQSYENIALCAEETIAQLQNKLEAAQDQLTVLTAQVEAEEQQASVLDSVNETINTLTQQLADAQQSYETNHEAAVNAQLAAEQAVATATETAEQAQEASQAAAEVQVEYLTAVAEEAAEIAQTLTEQGVSFAEDAADAAETVDQLTADVEQANGDLAQLIYQVAQGDTDAIANLDDANEQVQQLTEQLGEALAQSEELSQLAEDVTEAANEAVFAAEEAQEQLDAALVIVEDAVQVEEDAQEQTEEVIVEDAVEVEDDVQVEVDNSVEDEPVYHEEVVFEEAVYFAQQVTLDTARQTYQLAEEEAHKAVAEAEKIITEYKNAEGTAQDLQDYLVCAQDLSVSLSDQIQNAEENIQVLRKQADAGNEIAIASLPTAIEQYEQLVEQSQQAQINLQVAEENYFAAEKVVEQLEVAVEQAQQNGEKYVEIALRAEQLFEEAEYAYAVAKGEEFKIEAQNALEDQQSAQNLLNSLDGQVQNAQETTDTLYEYYQCAEEVAQNLIQQTQAAEEFLANVQEQAQQGDQQSVDALPAAEETLAQLTQQTEQAIDAADVAYEAYVEAEDTLNDAIALQDRASQAYEEAIEAANNATEQQEYYEQITQELVSEEDNQVSEETTEQQTEETTNLVEEGVSSTPEQAANEFIIYLTTDQDLQFIADNNWNWWNEDLDGFQEGGYGSCLCGCAGYGLPYGCDNAFYVILPQLEDVFSTAISEEKIGAGAVIAAQNIVQFFVQQVQLAEESLLFLNTQIESCTGNAQLALESLTEARDTLVQAQKISNDVYVQLLNLVTGDECLPFGNGDGFDDCVSESVLEQRRKVLELCQYARFTAEEASGASSKSSDQDSWAKSADENSSTLKNFYQCADEFMESLKHQVEQAWEQLQQLRLRAQDGDELAIAALQAAEEQYEYLKQQLTQATHSASSSYEAYTSALQTTEEAFIQANVAKEVADEAYAIAYKAQCDYESSVQTLKELQEDACDFGLFTTAWDAQGSASSAEETSDLVRLPSKGFARTFKNYYECVDEVADELYLQVMSAEETLYDLIDQVENGDQGSAFAIPAAEEFYLQLKQEYETAHEAALKAEEQYLHALDVYEEQAYVAATSVELANETAVTARQAFYDAVAAIDQSLVDQIFHTEELVEIANDAAIVANDAVAKAEETISDFLSWVTEETFVFTNNAQFEELLQVFITQAEESVYSDATLSAIEDIKSFFFEQSNDSSNEDQVNVLRQDGIYLVAVYKDILTAVESVAIAEETATVAEESLVQTSDQAATIATEYTNNFTSDYLEETSSVFEETFYNLLANLQVNAEESISSATTVSAAHDLVEYLFSEIQNAEDDQVNVLTQTANDALAVYYLIVVADETAARVVEDYPFTAYLPNHVNHEEVVIQEATEEVQQCLVEETTQQAEDVEEVFPTFSVEEVNDAIESFNQYVLDYAPWFEFPQIEICQIFPSGQFIMQYPIELLEGSLQTAEEVQVLVQSQYAATKETITLLQQLVEEGCAPETEQNLSKAEEQLAVLSTIADQIQVVIDLIVAADQAYEDISEFVVAYNENKAQAEFEKLSVEKQAIVLAEEAQAISIASQAEAEELIEQTNDLIQAFIEFVSEQQYNFADNEDYQFELIWATFTSLASDSVYSTETQVAAHEVYQFFNTLAEETTEEEQSALFTETAEQALEVYTSIVSTVEAVQVAQEDTYNAEEAILEAFGNLSNEEGENNDNDNEEQTNEDGTSGDDNETEDGDSLALTPTKECKSYIQVDKNNAASIMIALGNYLKQQEITDDVCFCFKSQAAQATQFIQIPNQNVKALVINARNRI